MSYGILIPCIIIPAFMYVKAAQMQHSKCIFNILPAATGYGAGLRFQEGVSLLSHHLGLARDVQ